MRYTDADLVGVLALVCMVVSGFALVVVNRTRDSKWADMVFASVLILSMGAGFGYLEDPEGWLEMSRPLIAANN